MCVALLDTERLRGGFFVGECNDGELDSSGLPTDRVGDGDVELVGFTGFCFDVASGFGLCEADDDDDDRDDERRDWVIFFTDDSRRLGDDEDRLGLCERCDRR